MGAPVDLEKLSLPQISRMLSLKSWLWLSGIVAAIFLGGMGFAAIIGMQPEPVAIADLKSELSAMATERDQARDDESKIKSELETRISDEDNRSLSLSAKITEANGALENVKTNLKACFERVNETNSDLGACVAKIGNLTPSLWLVHQGEGNGYPTGHDGHVANHDDRKDWDSTHYKAEACMQNGGPRIDARYAGRICGRGRAVGPFGVLDVGGGGCGHQLYVLACMPSD